MGLFRSLLGKAVRWQADRMRRSFLATLSDPVARQQKVLFEMIERNRQSAFGKDHHFGEIRTVSDFQKRVPISGYEYYSPYIERVKAGETSAMFGAEKLHMFAMTSGTTATRKFIPVTESYLHNYRRGWMIWGLQMYDDHRPLWFKTMVQIGSDWDEFRTSGNIPCGSISGLTFQMQKRVVRSTYCLPPQSVKLKEIQAKYYLIWRLGLLRDVAVMATANPSTMVNLARFGHQHAEQLIEDITHGRVDPQYNLSPELIRHEAKRLSPHKQRGDELRAIYRATGTLRPTDVWPHLGMIANWTGGSVGAYMRHYPDFYPGKAIRDIGLVASEGRMTIPITDHTPAGILEITSVFFEFVPVGEIDSPNPTVVQAHELEIGKEYFILLTTASGLYRYNIYDVVRCVDYYQNTPMVEFLNKGANFSNITGEKISEHQVVQAVQKALQQLDLKLTSYTLAPYFDEKMPYYRLLVEEQDLPKERQVEFLRAVEAELQKQNSEYESKRETHRLGAVRLQMLPQSTWQQWDRERLKRNGGTAEQYKHPCLIGDLEFVAKMPNQGMVELPEKSV